MNRRDVLRSLQNNLPEAVKECEKSIREDNPEMDQSTAIAICRDMNQRGVLSDWLEASPAEDRLNQRAMAEFRNPAEIRRVDEGAGVRYKRVMLLSPGTWADAGSQEHVDYNAEAIRASADNWVDLEAIRASIPDWHTLRNDERVERLAQLDEQVMLEEAAPVNFLHGPAMYGADSLDAIGEIPLDSIIVDDDGRLYADIVLDGDSPQSKTAIDLVDEVLEAAQTEGVEPPPVGPSVEIPADRVSVAEERGVKSLEQAYFSAVGIVFGPASRPVELGEQAEERAIAMAGADIDTGVVLRSNEIEDDSKSKTTPRHRRAMEEFDPEQMDDEELAETLRTMQEDMADLERALQDGDELEQLQDAIAQYQQAGEDLQQPVSEFIEWADGNTEMSSDELQELADAYLQTVEAESLDVTPVEGLLDWAEENGEAEDGADSGSESDQEATMAELEEVKQVVGEVAGHLSDISDMLQAAEQEREQELDELERRLSELEDEPVERSLTGQQSSAQLHDLDDGDAGDEEDTPSRPML